MDAIDKGPSVPDWLEEARQEWHTQATAGFGFGVMPGLDAIVTSSERREVILELCSKAMKRLRDYGPVVPKVELNAILMAGPQNMFPDDVPTELFERVGDAFMKLLREELTPEESDARIWLPRRKA
ncbi:hypothetical protein [Polyangium sp. y55x31]|uniref:hypothetical protein n=1 Tax=Polyangium sp. y55x31 TaxID=3042688 RepID=UPI0024825156|nr:hypothetical protein [Polyangium sp. y55x31]MDI1477112.1 hypothetical protein [Polyangium sp. y55x31]